jgi:hypothetical protein
MKRRRASVLAAASLVGLSGCSSRDGAGTGSPRPPEQVTTSSAEDVEILVSQLVVGSDAEGPDAFYRLQNVGDTDATVRIETVLSVEEGGTYSSFAVVTVPAGEEVTVRYRIVRFDDVPPAERDRLRRGEGVDFTVVVNGQERPDA